MSGFAFSAGGERFRFADLKDLLADRKSVV